MKKFASTLTASQIAFCRAVEAAGLASYSQAVKAVERNETTRINEWKKALAAK